MKSESKAKEKVEAKERRKKFNYSATYDCEISKKRGAAEGEKNIWKRTEEKLKISLHSEGQKKCGKSILINLQKQRVKCALLVFEEITKQREKTVKNKGNFFGGNFSISSVNC